MGDICGPGAVLFPALGDDDMGVLFIMILGITQIARVRFSHSSGVLEPTYTDW